MTYRIGREFANLIAGTDTVTQSYQGTSQVTYSGYWNYSTENTNVAAEKSAWDAAMSGATWVTGSCPDQFKNHFDHTFVSGNKDAVWMPFQRNKVLMDAAGRLVCTRNQTDCDERSRVYIYDSGANKIFGAGSFKRFLRPYVPQRLSFDVTLVDDPSGWYNTRITFCSPMEYSSIGTPVGGNPPVFLQLRRGDNDDPVFSGQPIWRMQLRGDIRNPYPGAQGEDYQTYRAVDIGVSGAGTYHWEFDLNFDPLAAGSGFAEVRVSKDKEKPITIFRERPLQLGYNYTGGDGKIYVALQPTAAQIYSFNVGTDSGTGTIEERCRFDNIRLDVL